MELRGAVLRLLQLRLDLGRSSLGYGQLILKSGRAGFGFTQLRLQLGGLVMGVAHLGLGFRQPVIQLANLVIEYQCHNYNSNGQKSDHESRRGKLFFGGGSRWIGHGETG